MSGFQALYEDFVLFPGIAELQTLRLAERGVADGRAGRPPQSHAQAYTGGYARGLLLGLADHRQVLLAVANAQRCPACREVVDNPHAVGCGCTGELLALEGGILATCGARDDFDPLHFYGPDQLRQVAADGLDVVTPEGEILNPRILLQ